jgi:hypothetical protein
MPAKSQAQKNFFQLVLAYKEGEVDEDEVSQDVIDTAEDMDKEEIKKFATEPVEEAFRRVVRNMIREEVSDEDARYGLFTTLDHMRGIEVREKRGRLIVQHPEGSHPVHVWDVEGEPHGEFQATVKVASARIPFENEISGSRREVASKIARRAKNEYQTSPAGRGR